MALLVNAAIQKARGFAINKTRAFAFLGDGTAYRQGKKIGTRRAHARACGRCGNPQTDSHDLPHGLLLLDSPEPWRTIPGATGAIQQIRAGFNPHQHVAWLVASDDVKKVAPGEHIGDYFGRAIWFVIVPFITLWCLYGAWLNKRDRERDRERWYGKRERRPR